MRRLLYLYTLAACFGIIACDDYDKWTTSPTAVLTFSDDTVAFDTVITGQGSSQRTLVAFNHNDRGLRIQSVELASGEASHFLVNVDGQYLYGGRGEDFEVFGKDSIYIRLAVNLPETDSDDIQPYADELVFLLESGVRQSVTLTAQGMDVTVMRGEIIAADTTLQAHRPYLVYDSLVVAAGAVLTLTEGCTLMFHDETSLLVHGSLKAIGAEEKPVTFRSDRTDHMFDYLPYDNTPNRWGGIHFFGDSHDNVLTQCDIHAGDYGIICDSTDVDVDTAPLLVMNNSVVHNVGGTGLQLRHCVTQVTGTQISNSLGDCVYILGGAHTFIQTTIAQFYPFSSARGDALYISNYANDTAYPILWAHFINCIITGYSEDVIMGNIVEGDDALCDYLFSNSLLRTVASDDTQRFVDIRYDLPDSVEVSGKDNFVHFDATNYIYDFTPDSLSAARGLADPAYAREYPTDRNGTSRLADGAPDAGAYEGK